MRGVTSVAKVVFPKNVSLLMPEPSYLALGVPKEEVVLLAVPVLIGRGGHPAVDRHPPRNLAFMSGTYRPTKLDG